MTSAEAGSLNPPQAAEERGMGKWELEDERRMQGSLCGLSVGVPSDKSVTARVEEKLVLLPMRCLLFGASAAAAALPLSPSPPPPPPVAIF